jgi:hypothetical protein
MAKKCFPLKAMEKWGKMDKKFNNSLIVGGIMLEVSSHTFF